MSGISPSTVAARALVVSKDRNVRQLIIEALEPLAIGALACEEVLEAVILLQRQKFESVIVDLTLGEAASIMIEQLRFSPANRTAVTFAITASSQGPQDTRDSMFVLSRPLSRAAVTQVLKAAYGLVVRERRRYFRCPITIPAYVRAGKPDEILCETVNISEGGVAIKTRTTIGSISPAAVRFSLPGHESPLSAETRVCWQYDSGVMGLEFKALPSRQKSELQEWLARKLDETLPPNVVSLFRTASQLSTQWLENRG